MVCVETQRIGGGKPLAELYAVYDSSQGKALSLVKVRARVLDETVTLLCELSEAALIGLKVPKGEVRLVRAVS